MQHSDLEFRESLCTRSASHTCIPTGRKEEITAIPEVVPAIVVDPLSMGARATPQQGVFFMLYSKWHFLVSS